MNTDYIFNFELATPIVIEDMDKENLKPIAEKLNLDYSVIDDVLHSRKSVRFFDSIESEHRTVSYCIRPRQLLNFNTFEVLNISEFEKQEPDKTSRIFHGSQAIKCLSVLAHVNLDMIMNIQIPLDIYYRCNHRQWVDISELIVKVIDRSNRLDKLIEMAAPNIIIINEERVLQEHIRFLECNTSLTRNDGTTIRSLNDVGYSLIYGDISKKEKSDEPIESVFDEDESGDEK